MALAVGVVEVALSLRTHWLGWVLADPMSLIVVGYQE
jgi:hypothetical protein